MIEELVDSVLENQDVYRKNAVMKHGIPQAPRRVRKRTRSRTTESSEPRPEPLEPRPEPARIDPERRPAWHDWVGPVIIGTLLGGSVLGGAYLWSNREPNTPAPTQQVDPKALIKWLDEEGYGG